MRTSIDGVDCLHNGFRGERFNVAEVFFTTEGVHTQYRDVMTADIDEVDEVLAKKIDSVRSEYLTEEYLAAIGTVQQDMTVL